MLLPMTATQRAERFGAFRFRPDPIPGNPEHIRIEAGWAEGNIEGFRIPQLLDARGKPRMVWMNRLAMQPMLDLFAEWGRLGLIPDVRTFDGGWAPRFKRQAGTYEQRVARCATLGAASLSNHAWGTAADFNAPWNQLGTPGAAPGAVGDMRPLAAVAERFGWYWGGNFRSRCDAMHLELAKDFDKIRG